MNVVLRIQGARHERKLTLVRFHIDEDLWRHALDCLDALDGRDFAFGERRPERRLAAIKYLLYRWMRVPVNFGGRGSHSHYFPLAVRCVMSVSLAISHSLIRTMAKQHVASRQATSSLA